MGDSSNIQNNQLSTEKVLPPELSEILPLELSAKIYGYLLQGTELQNLRLLAVLKNNQFSGKTYNELRHVLGSDYDDLEIFKPKTEQDASKLVKPELVQMTDLSTEDSEPKCLNKEQLRIALYEYAKDQEFTSSSIIHKSPDPVEVYCQQKGLLTPFESARYEWKKSYSDRKAEKRDFLNAAEKQAVECYFSSLLKAGRVWMALRLLWEYWDHCEDLNDGAAKTLLENLRCESAVAWDPGEFKIAVSPEACDRLERLLKYLHKTDMGGRLIYLAIFGGGHYRLRFLDHFSNDHPLMPICYAKSLQLKIANQEWDEATKCAWKVLESPHKSQCVFIFSLEYLINRAMKNKYYDAKMEVEKLSTYLKEYQGCQKGKLLKARLCMKAGEYPIALEWLDALPKERPEAILLRAEIAMKRRDYKNALEILEKIPEGSYHFRERCLIEGEIFEASRDCEAAAEAYSTAIEEDSIDEPARIGAVKNYLSAYKKNNIATEEPAAGNQRQAEKYIKNAVRLAEKLDLMKVTDESADVLLKLYSLSINSNCAKKCLLLAQRAVVIGKDEQIEEWLSIVTEDKVSEEDKDLFYWLQAKKHFDTLDYGQTFEAALMVKQESPYYGQAMKLLADFHKVEGNHLAVIKYAERVPKEDTAWEQAEFLLFEANFSLGRYHEASAYSNNHPLRMARVWFKQNQHGSALSLLAKTLKEIRERDSGTEILPQIFYLRAQILFEQGNYSGASSEINKIPPRNLMISPEAQSLKSSAEKRMLDSPANPSMSETESAVARLMVLKRYQEAADLLEACQIPSNERELTYSYYKVKFHLLRLRCNVFLERWSEARKIIDTETETKKLAERNSDQEELNLYKVLTYLALNEVDKAEAILLLSPNTSALSVPGLLSWLLWNHYNSEDAEVLRKVSEITIKRSSPYSWCSPIVESLKRISQYRIFLSNDKESENSKDTPSQFFDTTLDQPSNVPLLSLRQEWLELRSLVLKRQKKFGLAQIDRDRLMGIQLRNKRAADQSSVAAPVRNQV